MAKIHNLRNKLEQLKGQRTLHIAEIKALRLEIKELTKEIKTHEDARAVVRIVSAKTQENLKYHISDVTTLALESVFPDPYKLEIEFVQRRNKTEADIFFVRDGNRIDPLSASGGGAVDIASFALRIAAWSLQTPRKNNTIVLDEPMRFVSETYRPLAAQMIKEVSKRMGIQFVIVTHDPTITAFADNIIHVRKKGDVSNITSETVLRSY